VAQAVPDAGRPLMAALPYMPLYVADYLADAAHLTALQHGGYLLLLMNYWQRGKPLPNDDVQLARIARMGRKEWNANKAELRSFFYEEENLLKHGRVESELAKVEAKSLKCKKAAQASVQQRFGERSTDAERTLNHTDTDTRSKVPLVRTNGDSDTQFWDTAKAYLGKGKASLIGQWVRDHGKEETASAITAAQLERAINPVEFIQGRFRRAKQEGGLRVPC
jgi:uncharacterized protein YdaU (DUF1376 family)